MDREEEGRKKKKKNVLYGEKRDQRGRGSGRSKEESRKRKMPLFILYCKTIETVYKVVVRRRRLAERKKRALSARPVSSACHQWWATHRAYLPGGASALPSICVHVRHVISVLFSTCLVSSGRWFWNNNSWQQQNTFVNKRSADHQKRAHLEEKASDHRQSGRKV